MFGFLKTQKLYLKINFLFIIHTHLLTYLLTKTKKKNISKTKNLVDKKNLPKKICLMIFFFFFSSFYFLSEVFYIKVHCPVTSSVQWQNLTQIKKLASAVVFSTYIQVIFIYFCTKIQMYTKKKYIKISKNKNKILDKFKNLYVYNMCCFFSVCEFSPSTKHIIL
jgi:hypothetical protein